ncbi:hypothetical protein [Tomitella fengzijianii]|uniref:Uncharacterized protein n=2 Tax=Tomitella fengzijianii TaxID=2597660 RepID=A0A516X604_9ACTN|nr:hypothetical protein [Tomitella fengzijianii]QDQ98111.1 hypothetical protein FO059_13305 [Tomitella fengzijianii]
MPKSTEPIRSFSGCYAWSPRILDQIADLPEELAEQIADNIENNYCPRCDRPFDPEPLQPAGSRVTDCRSIPICSRCGSDEATEVMQGLGSADPGCSHPADWPLNVGDIDARHQWLLENTRIATLDVSAGGMHLVDEDGVTTVQATPSTGGWAEYGYRGSVVDEEEL